MDFKLLTNPQSISSSTDTLLRRSGKNDKKKTKFENKPNEYQTELLIWRKKIEDEQKLIIAADKNHLKVDQKEYKTMMEKKVQKDYKKETPANVDKLSKHKKKVEKIYL